MAEDILFIDFETYSAVDIKEAGGYAYAHDDSTQVICMGWAFNKEEPAIWTIRDKILPDRITEHVMRKGKVCAFNATFDFRIWNIVACRDFNWPGLIQEQLIDAQALCATYQIPQNLKDAGIALRIPLPKDTAGAALIKLCCQPNKQGEQPLPYGPLSETFQKLFYYCKRDVAAMQQIVYKLPRQFIIPQEQEIWNLTSEINARGLPIDLESVVAIYEYLLEYIAKTEIQLPKLTNGLVATPGQVAKIIAFCKSQGVHIPNLQADTVEQALDRDDLPSTVRQVLELRQELGRSSTAKYKKIIEQCYNGYIYDNIRYHGASTGRWTGQGFQMHNLPRASVENPEEWIEKFKNKEPIENPVGVAKALIRPMIKAPKGYTLAIADYTSIENYILAWAAGDEQTLQDLANGLDQYKIMASARFNVPYDQVTDEQRRVGKVIILGCGYGMGYKKFMQTAKLQAKLDLTDEEAIVSVQAYRDRYPLVKALWNGLRQAAAEAVMTGQKRQYKHTVFGTFSRNGLNWLAMVLPTKKALYYLNPSIKEELIKDYEFLGPVPIITHDGMDHYTHKFTKLKLIPGRLTENYVQATAREVMAYGMLNVKRNMPQVKIIGTVHDECIALIPNELATEETMAEYIHNLCAVDFLPGCPLKAKGFFSDRYKKG